MDDSSRVAFIEFLVQQHVLRFGDFITKSGRRSPYFFNFGNVCSGKSAATLGTWYAERIQELFPHHSNLCLFGPAYKGIPLAVSIAQILALRWARDVPYAFDRKESKDHGEGGNFIGHALRPHDQVLIVEDVLTSGMSIRHTLEILRPLGVQVLGALVGVDREEKGFGTHLARTELENEFNCPIFALLTASEIISQSSARGLLPPIDPPSQRVLLR